MYLNKLSLIIIIIAIVIVSVLIVIVYSKLKISFFRFLLILKGITRKIIFFLRRTSIKILKLVASQLIKSAKYLSEKKDGGKKLLYEDLTPTDDADHDKVYQDAILWALKNNNVRNIALTGTYGSGKSSIIKTFQKNHSNFEYLNISLATFNETAPDPNILELNILYQIFYYSKPQNISQSRYKRIEILSHWQIFTRILGIFLLALASFFLMKIDYFKNLPYMKTFIEININEIIIFSWLIVTLSFFFLFFWAFKVYHNFRVSKLNIASGEMELGETKESVLNGHLDEILYFFEVSKYNVVFIEDLDRFKNPVDIFTKLREINLLINNANRVKRNVVFIYALKDELFKEEQRTKFFDFIIPVIPVINSNNAKDMLSRKLKKAKIAERIPKEFIAYIAYYIDDMRLLLNIINELLLYKGKLLVNFDLQYDKLLGIIVYKNLCPDDFAALHENSGIVYNFIKNKRDYVNRISKKLVQQKNEITNQLNTIATEKLKSLAELRSLYLFKIYKYILDELTPSSYPETFTGEIKIGETFYLLKDIEQDETLFEQLFGIEEITYQYQYGHSFNTKSLAFSFTQIEDEVDSDQTFSVREQSLALVVTNEIEDVKQKLAEVENKLEICAHYAITDILENINIEELDDKLTNQPIISYLIRKGFLDENYANYISLFHPGTLTIEDKDFLLSVQHQIAKSFSHPLSNFEELLSDLSDYDFQHTYILNYNLLDYLLVTQEKNSKKLDLLLDQITIENRLALDFLKGYLMEGLERGHFIKSLVNKYVGFWDYVENKSNAPIQTKEYYFKLLLLNLSSNEIAVFNKNETLSSFIIKHENILGWLKENDLEDTGFNLLKTLKVKLKHIDFKTADTKAINFLYDNNLYEISITNINSIINFKLKDEPDRLENIGNAHLTTILHSGCNCLVEYILSEISWYAKNIFLKLQDNNEEKPDALLTLLSSDKIDPVIKTQIIKIQSKVFLDNIVKLDTKLYGDILENKKVIVSIPNTYEYWRNFGTDEKLINYLNDEDIYASLADQKVDRAFQQKASDFYKSIISNKNLSILALKSILKTFQIKYNNFNLGEVPHENAKLIITSGKLSLTKENFDFLDASSPAETLLFVEHYKKSFLKKVNNFSIRAPFYTAIFKSSKFSYEEKMGLLLKMDTGIIDQKNSDLADVAILLLKNNNQSITYKLLNSVIRYSTLLEEKILIINRYMTGSSMAQITEYLLALGHPYSRLTKRKAYIIIEHTPYHKKFAELLNSKALKDGKYISSEKNIDNDRKIRLNAKAK